MIVGRVGDGELRLDEVHRFPNDPVELPDGLHWDVLGLYGSVLEGLRRAAASAGAAGGSIASIGIDSWAVDFGLVDERGALLANPYHYRDARNATGVERVHAVVPARRALPPHRAPAPAVQHGVPAGGRARRSGVRPRAHAMLLIPDLLGAWLTGERAAERTNASTTALLDPVTGEWAWDLVDQLGLPRRLFPAIRQPGERLGSLLPAVAASTGLAAGDAGHPGRLARHRLCGRRRPGRGRRRSPTSRAGPGALVGVELDAPILTEAGRAANFTNEGGRRRDGPLPSQRDGPVAALGDDADLGARRDARTAGLDPAARPRPSRPAGP